MVFLVSQVWVQVLVMTFRGPGIQLGTWQVLLNVQMFWPGFRVKMFWPGFRVNWNDPDSGSIEMTRIPGQCKWPGFRVNANDPDSGSIQMTRIPGQCKWPGFRVNANDPDSGSMQMTRIPGQCKWPGFRVNSNDPDSGSMQMTRIPAGQNIVTRNPDQNIWTFKRTQLVPTLILGQWNVMAWTWTHTLLTRNTRDWVRCTWPLGHDHLKSDNCVH